MPFTERVALLVPSGEDSRDDMGEPTVLWERVDVDGCLVRQSMPRKLGDDGVPHPDGFSVQYVVALPKSFTASFDMGRLRGARLALPERGQDGDPHDALLVWGSPWPVKGAPTVWDAIVYAGKEVG